LNIGGQRFLSALEAGVSNFQKRFMDADRRVFQEPAALPAVKSSALKRFLRVEGMDRQG
jgi:hypothetical protein